jgi:hypothetical protein
MNSKLCKHIPSGLHSRLALLALLSAVVIAAGGQGAATASSELKPGKTSTYVAGNVFDLNLATAWVEGVEGDGVGEWVALELGETEDLGRFERLQLKIATGYQKTFEVLENNGAPTKLKVELSRGGEQLGQAGTTPDQNYSNELMAEFSNLKPGSGPLRVKLTIEAAKPGKKFHDTAISEIMPEFIGANPHQAREAADRFCRAVLKRDAAGLKEFSSKPASEVVNSFTNEFSNEVGCEATPLVRAGRTFDLFGAEGGDGAVMCRFTFDGAKWRLGPCNYISYL